MSASLQTLIKILSLEQSKGYQNNAVIGGFARFAFHWTREAKRQASDEQAAGQIDHIAELLRQYEIASESERPGLHSEIMAQAQAALQYQPTGTATVSIQPPAEQAPERPGVQETRPERPLRPERLSKQQAPRSEAPSHRDTPRPEKARAGAPAARASAEPDPEFAEFSGGSFDPAAVMDDLDEGFMPVEPEAEGPSPDLSVRERRGYGRRPQAPSDARVLDQISADLTQVKGVGEKRAELLDKLGAKSVADLIYLFPRRYDDFTRMKLIKDLTPGEEVTVTGVLERIHNQQMGSGRTRTEAYLDDGSAALRLNWFNQPWVEKQLEQGEPYVASGRIDQYLGRLVMNSPEMEPVEREWLHAGRVVPVYPLTKGLSGRTMRRLMKELVDAWAPRMPEFLPLDLRERVDLMDYDDAIAQMHFPDSWEDKEAAAYRLAFDEMLVLHLAMRQRRMAWQSIPAQALHPPQGWYEQLANSLPFALTGAQQRVAAEALGDMARDVPMNRLLQGDVGSGKTLIAAFALANAALCGAQGALMAPTSILAEQHYAKLSQTLQAAFGESIRVALLTSNVNGAEREAIYQGLADGSIQVAVGTHALIQEGVQFRNLALAIVDEQHRFGVSQRGALRDKAQGRSPHVLVMTATPIPRTLALTLHADLDLSIMDEMPPGRQPISTRVLQPKERERAYSFVRRQIDAGRQAYIICPLVEESEATDAKSAIAEYERLQKTVFPDLKIGLLHGRMNPVEKEAAMAEFHAGNTHVLVSTTVIEVGIDVPNATVIMVENANRFGLAQLHQLRGRVGRGEHESFCLLISDQPFLDEDDRLAILEATNDGFKLAEKDWELRGPGDLMGTQQAGIGGLRFIGGVSPQMIEIVQREAEIILQRDPQLQASEQQILARYVRQYAANSGDVS